MWTPVQTGQSASCSTFHNLGGGVAVEQEAAHIQSGERLRLEGIQIAFGLVCARAVDIHQHGPGDLHSVLGV